jgi:hypothetical protein
LRSTQFRGPDGANDWWAIACRDDSALCLREAGEVCPQGYDVADRARYNDVEAKTVAGGGSSFFVSNSSTRTITNGELTIRCKGASLAHQASDPECARPPNLRIGTPVCPGDGDSRRYLADDPREVAKRP